MNNYALNIDSRFRDRSEYLSASEFSFKISENIDSKNVIKMQISSSEFPNTSYEKQANGKGEYINRGIKKILGIKYTPDFIGKDYIIECKGRPNESFPLRWKLFKLWLTKNNIGKILYKPQNQKEVDLTINLIKESRKRKRQR